ncbi:MAG: hypothetical protein HEQ32_06200 [Vampirovibrio sp.]
MRSLEEAHPLFADQQKSLDVLEWPQVLAEVINRCPSVYGQSAWKTQVFLKEIDVLQKTQDEVACLMRILQRFGEPTHTPTGEFRSSLPALDTLNKSGRLSLLDFMDLYHGLHHGRHYINHVLKYRTAVSPQKTPFAHLLELPSPVGWWTFLNEKLTPDGDFRDNASPELAHLRRRKQSQENEITSTLQGMLQNPTVQKALQEPLIVQRNGRFVLPVNVFYKTSVPGIVQDVSSSGSTVFIEPKRVVELSNRLQETRTAIEREIERLLKDMSDTLALDAPDLLVFFKALAYLERHWAAARLAKDLEAYPLQLKASAQASFHFKQLKHPLLCLQNARHEIVGNEVWLGNSTEADMSIHDRCMIITGPNTGGKTVLLKSVGLAILMVQAGLLPVVAEESSMSYFESVLADIGDSQSLEHNLSTFSGQMTRLARFAQPETDLSQSLILLDEIAAGTDPIEGSALAKALLKRFYDKGACIMVTTHLGVLKQEAHHQAGYVNACVAFDVERLAPTYRLLIGVPGASNALAIAQRLGLDEALIQAAQAHMGSVQNESSALLTRLAQQNLEHENTLQDLNELKASLTQRQEEFKVEQQAFREKKKQLLTTYQAQFKSRLREFEDQAKRIKKELKATEASPQSLVFVQERIQRLTQRVNEQFKQEINPLDAELQAYQPEIKPYVYTVGEDVKHSKLTGRSVITSISSDGKKITLKNGVIHLVVKPSEIEPFGLSDVSIKALKKAEHRQLLHRIYQTHHSQGTPTIRGSFSLECDVRGKRTLDALETLEAFIDNAHMSGLNTVAVVHGQGTGALKKAVRDYLKASPLVADFYPEQAHLGGDGKTLIEMVP